MPKRLSARKPRFLMGIVALVSLLAALVWLYASAHEWLTGERLFPWSAYALCGSSRPDSLADTVRIGLYEEFPVPWRLDKLAMVDFPTTLSLTASSRGQFESLRDAVQSQYPQVVEVLFWPLLSKEAGYYPGPFSDAEAIKNAAAGADDLPVLLDWELPLGTPNISLANWWQVRSDTDAWLRSRSAPTHIWRAHTSMGLDPLFLRLVGIHYDPQDYPDLYLHLDLYTTGEGLPSDELYRIIRCGVEKYGDHFIPDFGSLDDREGPPEIFVPVATLRRYLEVARAAGVKEIWLFGVNGLNADYLSALHESLPLTPAP